MKPKCNAGGRCKGSHPLICEDHGCAITKPAKKPKATRLVLRRAMKTNSTCGSTKLAWLDWSNWFQDRGYIHVMKDDGEAFHRVYPKALKGYVCTRVAVYDRIPCWLYDWKA